MAGGRGRERVELRQRVALKLVDYFRAGTGQVWVIYPAIRQVYVYANPTSVRILAEPGEIDGGDLIPGFGSRCPSCSRTSPIPKAKRSRRGIDRRVSRAVTRRARPSPRRRVQPTSREHPS